MRVVDRQGGTAAAREELRCETWGGTAAAREQLKCETKGRTAAAGLGQLLRPEALGCHRGIAFLSHESALGGGGAAILFDDEQCKEYVGLGGVSYWVDEADHVNVTDPASGELWWWCWKSGGSGWFEEF